MMTYSDKLIEIEQDLQSAVSYSGGKNLKDIRNTASLAVTNWEV
jgi:hypothetical protein